MVTALLGTRFNADSNCTALVKLFRGDDGDAAPVFGS
jgi:hypothetical protein